MARCEVCNRKLKDPGKRMCGGNKCVATAAQKIPRCVVCGSLAIIGEPCPGGTDQYGNVTGKSIHHTTLDNKPMFPPEKRKEAV